MEACQRTGQVVHINPEGLSKNPAFTNVVVVTGSTRTIYVGGQDAEHAKGNMVGKEDVRAQTEQIFANLKAALAVARAGLEHVVKRSM